MLKRSIRCNNVEVYLSAILLGLPAAVSCAAIFAVGVRTVYHVSHIGWPALFELLLAFPAVALFVLCGRPALHALLTPLEFACNEHSVEIRCLLRRIHMHTGEILTVYTEPAYSLHPWFDRLWRWRRRYVYDTWILPVHGWVCIEYRHGSRVLTYRFIADRVPDLHSLEEMLHEFNPRIEARIIPVMRDFPSWL